MLLADSDAVDVVDIRLIAAVCGLMFVLAIVRMHGLVADQRQLAITDGLTGLRTRRFLEAQLSLEIARVRRGGVVGLFIIDVDHFKSINDRFGHPAGDLVLAEISHRLRDATRQQDVLARHGGEEFALLAPIVGQDELWVIGERLRDRVASGPIGLSDGEWAEVTVSVGAAACPLHARGEAELVSVADRALYAAKAAGRNRLVVGDGPQVTVASVSQNIDS